MLSFSCYLVPEIFKFLIKLLARLLVPTWLRKKFYELVKFECSVVFEKVAQVAKSWTKINHYQPNLVIF